MRKLFGALIYLVLMFFFSCEEHGWFANCSECQSSEPDLATLEIRLRKPENTSTALKIYEGELEDGIVLESVLTSVTEYKVTVRPNKKYTVTATYFIGGTTYVAVDSAIPRVKYTEEECEDPCYFVYDRKLDLSLKYLASGQ